ncbi:MAG: hypothetical protein V4658_08010 [Bacteroidota bacterium]
MLKLFTTMDADDFLDEEVQSNVQRYEKMVRNKTREFFEAETLEEICDYYIRKEKFKKALEVLYYGEEFYPNHIGFAIQKAEILMALQKFDEAVEVIEKVELFEPYNDEIALIKGEVLLNMGDEEGAEEEQPDDEGRAV